MSNDPVMYIVVNNDLQMGKGKIAAQVGHVVEKIIEELISFQSISTKKKSYLNDYFLWKKTGSTKIILKSTELELRELSLFEDSRYILDAGKTQIGEGSLTVVGFFPTKIKKDIFNKLKLL